MESRKNQAVKGSAAIAALICLTVLFCLGGGVARLMTTETATAINFHQGIAAQCIAEAGLRRAIVVLYKGGRIDDVERLAETITRGEFCGDYLISVKTLKAGEYWLKSVGKVGGARRAASVQIQLKNALDPQSDKPLVIMSWGN